MALLPCEQNQYITGIIPYLMCSELLVVAPPPFATIKAKLLECRHDYSTLMVLDGVAV